MANNFDAKLAQIKEDLEKVSKKAADVIDAPADEEA